MCPLYWHYSGYNEDYASKNSGQSLGKSSGGPLAGHVLLSARFSDYFKNILARPLGFFYERSK
jgi:hypothetical protein